MADEDLVVMQPDPLGAIAVLGTASDLLESARGGFARGDYEAAFTDARDSMRISSSAILIRDGYVATTLDATVSYLEERYAGTLPLDSWEQMETAFPAETMGVMGRLIGSLGKNKKPDKENTEHALAVAGAFLSSARAIVEASK